MNSFSRLFSLFIFILIIAPIIFLTLSFNEAQGENWSHFINYLFPQMSKETFILVLGVIIGTSTIAIPLAYLHTFYHYPGKKILDAFFILPMAFPIYVYAAISLSLFGLTGEITQIISLKFNISPLKLNIKNIFGLIQVFSFALYPYLYITLKEAFLIHGQHAFEVGANLGLTRLQIIRKILMPISLPWFMAGIALIIMETLADFGASSMFNVTTFTTSIYRAWFGMFSLTTASQIASILVLTIFILFLSYKYLENRKNYSMATKSKKINPKPIKGINLIFFYLIILTFISLTLFIPLVFLIKNSFHAISSNFESIYSFLKEPALNTLFLSIIGSTLVIIVSIILAYFSRFKLKSFEIIWFEITKMGYAIPGTILAVAIYIPLTYLDKFIFNKNVLILTIIPLLIGYLIRFLPISLNPLEATFKKISNSQIAVMNNLGINKYLRWKIIYFPLSKSTIISSFFLVFLEIMKELPITLMTRPIGKDTLAVKIFEYTSEGDWERASLPSLLLIILGIFAIQFVANQIKHKE